MTAQRPTGLLFSTTCPIELELELADLFPITPRGFSAFLFDMDGTILSSIAAAERAWTAWFNRHGLDAEALMPMIHGVRAIETISRLALPGVDAEAENAWLTQAEMDDVDGIVPIEGAAAFLSGLPTDRWAVVTSAPRKLAERRLRAAGLPLPPMMVSGDDVERGKPAPDCFLLGASRLGFRAEDCLAFEDAPAGIASAEAAGTKVLVITATHGHPVSTPHPTVANYDGLSIRQDGSGWIAPVRSALRP